MANNAAVSRDPYLWQNDDVLKNRLDIHDAAQLRKAELSFSAARLATLELGTSTLGLPYLCHIHRTLFQDVYSWAGELRTIDIWRDETPFCHFEYIEKEGNTLMSALEEEKGLTDLPREEFVQRIAHYYCEINMLHPFREGNGRAQRIFSSNWRCMRVICWTGIKSKLSRGSPLTRLAHLATWNRWKRSLRK